MLQQKTIFLLLINLTILVSEYAKASQPVATTRFSHQKELNSLLLQAIQNDNRDDVESLIQQGAPVKHLPDQQESTLIIACKHNAVQVAKLLLDTFYIKSSNQEQKIEIRTALDIVCDNYIMWVNCYPFDAQTEINYKNLLYKIDSKIAQK